MTLYKHKCSCGESCFSNEENQYECDYSNPDDEDEEANHIVSRVKRLTAQDYVEMWESELEDANRHSITEMPTDIFNILKSTIKDTKLVTKSIKKMYEQGIGI